MKKICSIHDVYRKARDRFAPYLPTVQRPLLDWAQEFLPHYLVNEPSDMHRWLADRIDTFNDRGQKVAAIGPRGGAKSTIGTLACTLKRACEGAETNIMIISDTASQAWDHLRAVKTELENNDALADAYPSACGEGPIWRENAIQLRNGVLVRAHGTLSRIRGRRNAQYRPSLIILDDPENDQHISSEKMRERTLEWFNQTLMSMGDASTNYLALGTALHRECLMLGLLQTPGWETYRPHGKPSPFQAIVSWPTRMDLWDSWEQIYQDVERAGSGKRASAFFRKNRKDMLRGSKVLWPDREPLYFLMERRAEIGHQAFEAEKQGSPINPESCEWPEKYFTHDKFFFDQWPNSAETAVRVIAVDPSKGKDAGRGDYSAIVKLAVDSSGVFYVDANLKRRPVDQIIADTLEEHRRFRPLKLGIETNQFQSLIVEELLEEATARDVHVDVVELDNRVKKQMRIRRLSPLLAQRRLRFRRGSEGAALLVQQLRDFPVGDFDDGPDALEMAARIAADVMEGEDEDLVAGNLEID